MTLMALFLFAGNLAGQSNDQFILNGVIDTIPNAQYFVSFQSKGKVFRDTISLDEKGRFTYIGRISEPTIFRLNIKNDFNSYFVGDATVYSFWVQPGKTMNFKGNRGWLVRGAKGLAIKDKQFTIKGSDFEDIEQSFKREITVAMEVAEKKKKADLDSKERIELIDSIVNNFVSRQPLNYYGLYLLHQESKKRNSEAVSLRKIFDQYPDELKNTYLGLETKDRAYIKLQTEIGAKLPDFEQADTSLNLVKLSDYRGKYVLIDFWASWCLPCRKENPNLVEAYKKYHAKGLEIIGISLDNDKKLWLDAINKDGLDWTQLSDLKSFDNVVAKKFYIHAVPDNFLIDPNGIIIGRGLIGTQLSEMLKKIFD